MLKCIWNQKSNILALAALWLVFECWISWSASCGPARNQYEYYKTAEEYCSAFKGPFVSTIRFIFIWFGYVLDDHTEAVTALATAAIAWFTWTLWQSTEKMWIVTQSSVDVARQAYAAEHRTWLKVYPTEIGPIECENGKIKVSVTIEAENVGNNPAVAVSLACQMFRAKGFGIGTPETSKLVEREQQFAALGSKGVELLPGEKTSTRFTADAETVPRLAEAFRKQIEAGVPEKNLLFVLSAAYCVIYKSVASNDWNYSSHMLWIGRIDKGTFDTPTGTFPVGTVRGTVLPGESRFA